MNTFPRVSLNLANLDSDRIALHCRYGDRVDPQPAYVEIDEDGAVFADYDGEIGNAVPMTVWHKRTLRVPVAPEADCTDLAAYLRGPGLALLQRIHDGHTVEWDGSNHVGALTSDAEAALDQLGAELQDLPTVEIWTAEDWLFGADQTLADAWPDNQTLDQAAAECADSYSAAAPGIVQGNASRALMDRARAEWREHPDRLARVHVDALRAAGHITAQQAADWVDEYTPSIEAILERYNAHEVARDCSSAQEFADQVIGAEPVAHLNLDEVRRAAVAWYDEHVQMVRDNRLEEAFVDAIGQQAYDRLIAEQWRPFAGTAHLRLSIDDAVSREVQAARGFLEDLDFAAAVDEHVISAHVGDSADLIELTFDPVRPESPVWYRYPDVSSEWQNCPFQSADLSHLSNEAACATVDAWVG